MNLSSTASSPDSREHAGADAARAAKLRLWRFRLIACGVSSGISLLGLFLFLEYRARMGPIILRAPNRATGIQLLYDPLLGWRNIPHLKTTTFGHPMTINSRGLRGRECPVEKPPGTFRVLVLGDSFAWGYGVGDDEVFSEVLNRLLRESGGRCEVINTGVSGWGTDQEYLYLVNEGFDYSPDVVVLAVYLANDPGDNATSKAYGRSKPVFLDADLEVANVPVPKPWEDRPTLSAQIDEIDLTLAIISKIADECAARDCPLVVMTFGTFMDPRDQFIQYVGLRFVGALTGDTKLDYLDLDEQFADRRLKKDDLCRGNYDAHWNAVGHRETAKILHQFLMERKLVPTPGKEG